MSSFALKAIALVAMLFDHIACVFGWEGWDLLSFNASVLRYMGRMSFPIFAFCVVNGWKHTHNKRKYFINLCLCAIVSQIPFSLAFYTPNKMEIMASEQAFSHIIVPIFIILGLICAFTYWYFILDRKIDKSLLIVWVVTTLPFLSLKLNYMWVLTSNLNVLYTLAIGVFAFFFLETIQNRKLKWWEYIWLTLVLALVVIAFCPISDYGISMMGLTLIVTLYATQKWKWLQCLSIVAWGCIYYGLVVGNWYNALATVLPAVLIIFYNHKSGAKSKLGKHLFYVAYPAHLLIIGLANVFLKVVN